MAEGLLVDVRFKAENTTPIYRYQIGDEEVISLDFGLLSVGVYPDKILEIEGASLTFKDSDDSEPIYIGTYAVMPSDIMFNPPEWMYLEWNVSGTMTVSMVERDKPIGSLISGRIEVWLVDPLEETKIGDYPGVWVK